MLIRPVRREDLNDIMDLVFQSGFGLTNLPKDRDLIAQRIHESTLLFSGDSKKGAESTYLLVMEDTASGRVVGTGGIVPQVGVGMPFYAYRIETHVTESPSLGIRKELECLHLLTMSDGPSEIGALFVHPDYQSHGHGRLMSLSRFLFLAEHPELFSTVVIAEMRGVADEEGKSPFWEAFGRLFFDMDFPRADYLSARDKTFIAELMPRHPVYVLLLPRSAQAVIGQVHEGSRPALRLLSQEGFVDAGMVDIFDGGSIVRCKRNEIRTVKESRAGEFSRTLRPEEGETMWIISKGRLNTFRACIGAIVEGGSDDVRISARAAAALALKPGEKIRYAPLRPGKGNNR